MSEKSITTTTSFMNPSGDTLVKPPLSSDSSIDSGCNSSTSDSIRSNHQCSSISNMSGTCSITNFPHQNGTRSNLLILPAQPSVPPPAPPAPPPPLVLPQEDAYSANTDSNGNLSSFYQRLPSQPKSDMSTYATYAPTASPIHRDQHCSVPTIILADQNQSQKQQSSPQSQTTFQQTVINQRSSTSSLESTSSMPLMPMNVKGMLLHGLPGEEVMRNWLASINCDEQIENFVYHGYDMHLVTRMTPQDLAAIGCKSPALRKKLLSEIKKLNLDYEIPEPHPTTTLVKWLESLKLTQYYNTLLNEGFETIEKACQLTWEDLEEIGINKLGHQKRLLMAIDRIRKAAKQSEDNQHDINAIYDVHPNHRISLNGSNSDGCKVGTLGRVRSGLFQTRSGATLDHRGLPIATVTPALKHVSTPMMNTSINQQVSNTTTTRVQDQQNGGGDKISISSLNSIPAGSNTSPVSALNNDPHQIYESTNQRPESVYMSDFNSTVKRQSRPLPPVRTNSLKEPHGLGGQQIYSTNNTMNCNTNSTSFLRTPKLGTLTATTNKMLTSGGHIQTLSGDPSTAVGRSMFSPVREAPLPPVKQHVIQSSVHEKIEEEPSLYTTTVDSMDKQNRYSMPVSAPDGSPMGFMNIPQFASSDEFPPPPPCQ